MAYFLHEELLFVHWGVLLFFCDKKTVEKNKKMFFKKKEKYLIFDEMSDYDSFGHFSFKYFVVLA